ncbi:MAG: hypothetical protein JOZ58_14875 [Acetobacteraceae bacterium]|nr:hypothetical protein [Acetobacteraceae bacterium]
MSALEPKAVSQSEIDQLSAPSRQISCRSGGLALSLGIVTLCGTSSILLAPRARRF